MHIGCSSCHWHGVRCVQSQPCCKLQRHVPFDAHPHYRRWCRHGSNIWLQHGEIWHNFTSISGRRILKLLSTPCISPFVSYLIISPRTRTRLRFHLSYSTVWIYIQTCVLYHHMHWLLTRRFRTASRLFRPIMSLQALPLDAAMALCACLMASGASAVTRRLRR